jgi:membrane peptidoglycan carboxypeptidase
VHNVNGGSLPATIFQRFMSRAIRDPGFANGGDFPKPDSFPGKILGQRVAFVDQSPQTPTSVGASTPTTAKTKVTTASPTPPTTSASPKPTTPPQTAPPQQPPPTQPPPEPPPTRPPPTRPPHA